MGYVKIFQVEIGYYTWSNFPDEIFQVQIFQVEKIQVEKIHVQKIKVWKIEGEKSKMKKIPGKIC